ncbi:type I restriction endonuclease subunit R [candidate division KSB1 bacterium]|nr:type I restriction endonuclease subunit R [candidate division KSB1 bacterium]
MITEEQLEQLCIHWFTENGWDYAFGPDICPDGSMPERIDYRDVILFDRLLAALQTINSRIPQSILYDTARAIANASHPVLTQNNRQFHTWLLHGVPVEYSDGDTVRHDHVQLIDFGRVEQNQFMIVNQFTVQGSKQARRPDVMAFINGLPIAVIELKNPADENADIWNAYNQLQTYKDEIPDLFIFNEALVISDGVTARLGSLTANKEWFLPWRTIKNENDKPQLEYELEKIVKGFFDRELLLDYIHHFILFEENGSLIKKIAGYHQFHAVREAVRVTMIASRANDDLRITDGQRARWGKVVTPGSRKAGVVWHTQGSGKSISMVCYAGKLLQQPDMNNPTIVVVTDRNDLDGQLFGTFSSASELLRQTPQQAGSRDELRQMISERQSGGIIFTTVQKFMMLEHESKHPVLNDRSNIVVISDEAHRSQYGFMAKLDKKTGRYKYGFAKHMRDALPNATFIGFTGTPVSAADHDTRAVFGDYISIYDIQDAVDDGATVPIYYESRLAKLDINKAEIETLNRDVDDVLEDEEDLARREQSKSKWAALEKLVGAEPRLREVADDLVRHFQTRLQILDGKAMIVCMSREICVNMFNAITELRPEWRGTLRKDKPDSNGYYDPTDGVIRVIMTGNATDRAALQQHVHTKAQKKTLENRFKDPDDPLKLIIVRDMWLTGFDAPPCHTMYVDKPMKGHNLMQAIARVNRVFKDKPGGLVVDYIGVANDLKQALKDYVESDGKGAPSLNVDQAYEILLEKLDIIRAMFHEFDYSAYETEALKLLVPAANHILGIEDGKKRFLDVIAALTKAYALCGTLDKAAMARKEIAFFTAIKSAISKYTHVEKKRSEEEKHSALKQILDNAVIADGVADIFELAGLDKPNIGLLSDEFLEDVRNMSSKNLAIELLQKLLKDAIKSRSRRNIVQEKKYSDMLIDTLRRYHNRAIETAQVIEELIRMAKDFQEALRRDDNLGLNPDEVAFYHALANNESAVRELGDATLKQIAVELTLKLRQNTGVDWQVRENVRAKLRNLVRRLLRKYKYPPDKQQQAIDLVLEQAESLASEWGDRN